MRSPRAPTTIRSMKPSVRAAVGLAVLVVAILLVRVWTLPTPPVSLETANVRGSPNAPIEIEEWGDFG
jgi:hypothetical protein